MSVRDIVQLTCKEMVELTTEYLSSALDQADRVTFEQHLFGCTWCMTHLHQVHRTIEIVGQLKEEVDAAPVETEKLAAVFRRWKEGR